MCSMMRAHHFGFTALAFDPFVARVDKLKLIGHVAHVVSVALPVRFGKSH